MGMALDGGANPERRGENGWWNEERGGGAPPYIGGRGRWHLTRISLSEGGAHPGRRPLGVNPRMPHPLLGHRPLMGCHMVAH
jgi:hypothetical protein